MKTHKGAPVHRRHYWTPAEERTLKEMYPDTPMKALIDLFDAPARTIHQKANRLGARRSAAFLAGPNGCRIQPGSGIGRGSCYAPGHVPANKGLRRHGWAPGRMSQTQFKSGCRSPTWVPVGTEVCTPDGYIKRKTRDDLTPSRANWAYVHRLTWEAANGPIPAGSVVVFRDGNAENCRTVSNLELVSRQRLMRRNSVQQLPAILREVIRLRAALVHRIHHRSS